jgi:hypothetical protein
MAPKNSSELRKQIAFHRSDRKQQGDCSAPQLNGNFLPLRGLRHLHSIHLQHADERSRNFALAGT